MPKFQLMVVFRSQTLFSTPLFTVTVLGPQKKHISAFPQIKDTQTAYILPNVLILLTLKIKTHVILCSSSSVAVSEVSGGTAALPTCWLLLRTLSGLRDPPGDHQRETWRPVTHRQPENQETAVRTPTAMMSPVTTALSSGCLDATHTLSPQQHVISTSHGNQGCTYVKHHRR